MFKRDRWVPVTLNLKLKRLLNLRCLLFQHEAQKIIGGYGDNAVLLQYSMGEILEVCGHNDCCPYVISGGDHMGIIRVWQFNAVKSRLIALNECIRKRLIHEQFYPS